MLDKRPGHGSALLGVLPRREFFHVADADQLGGLQDVRVGYAESCGQGFPGGVFLEFADSQFLDQLVVGDLLALLRLSIGTRVFFDPASAGSEEVKGLSQRLWIVSKIRSKHLLGELLRLLFERRAFGRRLAPPAALLRGHQELVVPAFGACGCRNGNAPPLPAMHQRDGPGDRPHRSRLCGSGLRDARTGVEQCRSRSDQPGSFIVTRWPGVNAELDVALHVDDHAGAVLQIAHVERVRIRVPGDEVSRAIDAIADRHLLLDENLGALDGQADALVNVDFDVLRKFASGAPINGMAPCCAKCISSQRSAKAWARVPSSAYSDVSSGIPSDNTIEPGQVIHCSALDGLSLA